MAFALGGIMMIFLHLAPTGAGMAWSIHQNGFHVDYPAQPSPLMRPNKMGVVHHRKLVKTHQ